MDLKAILTKLKSGTALTAEEMAFLEGLKTVDIDSVKDFLEKDDAGKKHLQSLTDAAVTKGINTFKEKTMPSLLEEEIKRKFPAETEEQKQLRQLKESQDRLAADYKREKLLNKALSVATEKKLPLKLIERFLGDDEETTLKNLELLETEYNSAITTEVESKFKENGRGTPGGGGNPPQDPSKMSDDEYIKSRVQEQSKK
ncbi:MAG TPA: DUF4355 domain-containing protein [Ignavibacteriales bacterium]|nr:DUF4355 domain-containing protein [Ignavibacteriales bacterium]